jgi:hypothetical protein
LKYFVFFLITFISNSFFGQEPYAFNFNDENGLPSNEVYQIIQDKKGYLWIGCDAGIFRYNGFQWKGYYNSRQNARSVSFLQIDKTGTLWCRNFNGQLFRVEGDSLRLVADYSKKSNKFQVTLDLEGGYWYIDSEKITHNNRLGKVTEKIPLWIGSKIFDSGIQLIFFKNTLWVELPKIGLFYLHPQKKKLISVSPIDKKKSYQALQFFLHKNHLYLVRSEAAPAPQNYIYEIISEKKTTKYIYRFDNVFQIRNYSFNDDKHGNIWVGSSFGAICIPNIHYFTVPKFICFYNHKISSVLEDSEGNIWLTDLQNGIYRIPSVDTKKYSLNNEIESEQDVSAIKDIGNGQLLVGFYSGRVALYLPGFFDLEPISSINKLNGITVKDIEFQENKALIARGTLTIYDHGKSTAFLAEKYSHPRDLEIVGDTVFAIHPEFVLKYNWKTIKKGQKLQPTILVPTGGRKLIFDPHSKTLLFALTNGLFKYKDGELTELKWNNKSVYAYSFVISNKSIWVGTLNDGLIEVKNGRINRHYALNNIADKLIKAITTNGKNLYFSTPTDLLQFSLKKAKITKLSRNKGINPIDVNVMTFSGGNLFIGTKKGLFKIQNTNDLFVKKNPTIYFEKISSSNGVLKTNLLPYNFHDLKFEFIAFAYGSGRDLKYEYRMKGQDLNWKTTTYDQPSVTFSSLQPGTYQFEVRAIDDSGNKSRTLKKVVIIDAAFWQEIWFYIILTLLSIGLVIIVARFQISRIRKHNNIEKRYIQSQLTALKAQMNPHFMYNALNSIQALIVKQDIKSSNLYLSKFSNLMRKVLEASGKEEISLEEEIAILELYLDLEKLRFGNDFNFEIRIAAEIEIYSIYISPLLLQPFVENAIKHGLLHKHGEKNLVIEIKKDKELICVIEDNGIGRKKSEEIKQRNERNFMSFATKASEKRMELLTQMRGEKYKISIFDLEENGEAKGTRVEIMIPIVSY